MNAVKMTLVSMVLTAAMGLALGLSAAPAEAHGSSTDCMHKNESHQHCSDDGGGGGPHHVAVDVVFQSTQPIPNTIGADEIGLVYLDGVDGIGGSISVGGGFQLTTGDKRARELWVDLGEIGAEIDGIAEDDCPFLAVHREVEGRCAAFTFGALNAHTVIDAGENRLLTMAENVVGTVTPNPVDSTIFRRFDVGFSAYLNPSGKKVQWWSILFNGDTSVSNIADCTANTSLRIVRFPADTWVIDTTDTPQTACLFAHTSNKGGVTPMGTVEVDLMYTITCVDPSCPAP